ncbi:transposase domain-containing protein [Acetobacterium malicum]|uniref:transposase domain-containing protein n=1 Tax=Acetobacterium malicum TaxID=52692 RepID=UPI001FA6BA8D|nr:transposase domain-containing protein [Acetobacterium dehalogenans]
MESARANELDVFEYLNYLLTEIPNSDYLHQPEGLEKYLPWSSDLPDRCRLSHNYKKCLK